MSGRWTDRIKRAIATVVLLAAVVVAAVILFRGEGAKSGERWTFLDTASLAELGLVAHGAKGGAWGLEEHEEATGGRALANHEGEPGASPALLVATGPRARDVRAKTRCKVVGSSSTHEVSAGAAAACGVVFRFVDEQNHWLARADVAAQKLEVVVVIRGEERLIKSGPVQTSLAIGSWIELAVEARGDVVRATLGSEPTLVAEGTTFPAASGAIGLWAPSETMVFFDHFGIETLSAAPRALEILPLLGKRP